MSNRKRESKANATFRRYRADGRLGEDQQRVRAQAEILGRQAARAAKRGEEEDAAADRADAQDLGGLERASGKLDWEGAFERLEEMDTAVADRVPRRLTSMLWRKVLGHEGMGR